MTDTWQHLIGNLAVVALFISGWVHGQFLFNGRPVLLRNTVYGVVMGLGAIASMFLAVRVEPGLLFDLRSALIALGAFFGGPVAALVSLAIAIIGRTLMGGSGALLGAIGMTMTATAAIAVSMATRGRLPDLWSAVILSAAVSLTTPVISLFIVATGPNSTGAPGIWSFAALNFAATLISSFFFMRQRTIERERDLLRAAFVQAPDFHYVKTPQSRFVAVNENTARFHGFNSPGAMAGKTDLDLEAIQPERAAVLVADEQEIVATGKGFSNREEVIVDEFGDEVWLSTSKVPLHNAEGEIIGLAGVTHDITAMKRLETDLTRNRNRLDYVLSGVSDGIAMFDSQGTLVYSNAQYRSHFPLTAEVRRSGQHIRDILEAVVETKEQVIKPGHEREWVEEIAGSLKHVSEEEVELFDGRWLLIRTRPTSDGSALVMVSDLTKIKHAESALRSLTDQLKLLATTDGLTGLTNRRAFDAALDNELARCRRSGEPISVMLADVDRFKTYNDIYGHQSGDDVLRNVALCLKGALRRPADVAARYGGEEFVGILPGTNEDGAFFIADAFRESLFKRGIAHKGGDKGVVTVSVGIATFTNLEKDLDAAELVRRADEALYNAKGAGRDRVTGWREHFEVQSVGGMVA
jgi:diguanylate cyclase (GGDEF)-like protein/PAS domain S-box-containing protein